MKHHRRPVLQPGEVAILWRIRKEWRDGSWHDRQWHFYHTATASDAKTFMQKKSPHDDFFCYTVTDKLPERRKPMTHTTATAQPHEPPPNAVPEVPTNAELRNSTAPALGDGVPCDVLAPS